VSGALRSAALPRYVREDVVGWLDGLNFMVTDAVKSTGRAIDKGATADLSPAGAGAGGVAGGGFTMSTEEMTTLLAQVKATRDKCQEQVGDDRQVFTLRPPAQDQGSMTFTSAAQASRDARNKYLADQLEMYNELVAKLEQALGITVEADQRAAEATKQAGGEGKFS
jgi:hypothetical protein